MDDIVYEVGLTDNTEAVIDRINKKLDQVAERQAKVTRFNVEMNPAAADSFKSIAEKAAAKPIKFNVVPINPLPAGFGDKMATEAEGGLRRIDRGLNLTFGGIGNLMAGNFRAGMMQINAGIAEMTGRSTEALGKIAVKAGAIGGAFAGGFAIGGAIDQLFGISDRIAKNFEAVLDPVTQFRDTMREASRVNLENLVGQLKNVADASKKAVDAAGLIRDIEVASARYAGSDEGEIASEKRFLSTRESEAQKNIDDAAARRNELRSNESFYRGELERQQKSGADPQEIEMTRVKMQAAYRDNRAGAPALQKTIDENKQELQRISAAKIDIETRDEKRIADQKEAADKKETSRKEAEKTKIDAIFEKRDKKVADTKQFLDAEVHRQQVQGLEQANQADAKRIDQSRDRQEKLAKVISEKTELEQQGPHERRLAKREGREKEHEKKLAEHRQKVLEESALKAQDRIEHAGMGRGLGGKLSKRQQEALDAIQARQDLKDEKAKADKAQKDIADRNERLAELAEEASLERLEQIRLLGVVSGKLSLG